MTRHPQRYENLLDENPLNTKTFRSKTYENLLDPKDMAGRTESYLCSLEMMSCLPRREALSLEARTGNGAGNNVVFLFQLFSLWRLLIAIEFDRLVLRRFTSPTTPATLCRSSNMNHHEFLTMTRRLMSRVYPASSNA